MIRRAPLALTLLLAGCIPPSPQYPNDNAPRLDTDLETIFGERPAWEAQPVIADQNAIAGEFHIVQPGDTGIAIARAYGVPWARVVEVNGLSEPFILRIGQRLILPGASAPAEQSVEARAAAFKLDIDDILTGGEPAQPVGGELVVADPAPRRALPPRIAVAEPSRFSGGFIWPVKGTVTDRFGPIGEGEVNKGIEIATSPSAPIRASSDGVIAFVGNDVAGYGGMILIRHGNAWITAYGRAARTTVTRGQSVKRGDVIGATGAGSAPKLHFEMRKQRVPVDPLKQLPPQLPPA